MRNKVVAPKTVSVAKVKKAKVAWTKESAITFITKASTKGLKYWGAVDYLAKFHGANKNDYYGIDIKKKRASKKA